MSEDKKIEGSSPAEALARLFKVTPKTKAKPEPTPSPDDR